MANVSSPPPPERNSLTAGTPIVSLFRAVLAYGGSLPAEVYRQLTQIYQLSSTSDIKCYGEHRLAYPSGRSSNPDPGDLVRSLHWQSPARALEQELEYPLDTRAKVEWQQNLTPTQGGLELWEQAGSFSAMLLRTQLYIDLSIVQLGFLIAVACWPVSIPIKRKPFPSRQAPLPLPYRKNAPGSVPDTDPGQNCYSVVSKLLTASRVPFPLTAEPANIRRTNSTSPGPPRGFCCA